MRSIALAAVWILLPVCASACRGAPTLQADTYNITYRETNWEESELDITDHLVIDPHTAVRIAQIAREQFPDFADADHVSIVDDAAGGVFVVDFVASAEQVGGDLMVVVDRRTGGILRVCAGE